MSKLVLVEYSPNGVLGRVMGDNLIVYPGIFLGLPFDVHMTRGTPVYGPDVSPEDVVSTPSPFVWPCGCSNVRLCETHRRMQSLREIEGGV